MRPSATGLKTMPPSSVIHDPIENLLINGPLDAPSTLILAHGAGQGPESPFLQAMAVRLAGRGLRVVRFAFPYMLQARTEGRRRPPQREPALIEAWHRVITHAVAASGRLLIGGKSMGGRIASLIADETGAAGLVCLGYPFHPPGRPESLRIAHLASLRTPTLICQGARDPFGNRAEVAGYSLGCAVRLHWIDDGDHDFRPRKVSGRTWADNLEAAADAVAAFAVEAQ